MLSEKCARLDGLAKIRGQTYTGLETHDFLSIEKRHRTILTVNANRFFGSSICELPLPVPTYFGIDKCSCQHPCVYPRRPNALKTLTCGWAQAECNSIESTSVYAWVCTDLVCSPGSVQWVGARVSRHVTISSGNALGDVPTASHSVREAYIDEWKRVHIILNCQKEETEDNKRELHLLKVTGLSAVHIADLLLPRRTWQAIKELITQAWHTRSSAPTEKRSAAYDISIVV